MRTLKRVSAALETKASITTPANDTESGHLLKIATALEALAGASTTANANRFGYLTRAVRAAEALSGTSPAGKNDNEEGLLTRLVNSLEAKAGAVTVGSLEGRLDVAAANAVFSAVFSPASLSPVAWYDPSDLSTLFQDAAGTIPVAADGDAVGKILDKSGNGLHLTQATAASRPLYKTSGGLSWLQFDGVDDRLASSTGVTPSNQMAAAVALLATGASALPAYHSVVSATDALAIRAGNVASGFTTNWTNGAVIGKSAVGTGAATVLTAELDKTVPSVALRANSAAAATSSTTGPGTTTGTRLGSNVTSFFPGRVFAVVQAGRALTGPERASLETYLGAKCGIVL